MNKRLKNQVDKAVSEERWKHVGVTNYLDISKIDEVYARHKSYRKFKEGDVVYYKDSDNNRKFTISHVVVGKSENGTIYLSEILPSGNLSQRIYQAEYVNDRYTLLYDDKYLNSKMFDTEFDPTKEADKVRKKKDRMNRFIKKNRALTPNENGSYNGKDIKDMISNFNGGSLKLYIPIGLLKTYKDEFVHSVYESKYGSLFTNNFNSIKWCEVTNIDISKEVYPHNYFSRPPTEIHLKVMCKYNDADIIANIELINRHNIDKINDLNRIIQNDQSIQNYKLGSLTTSIYVDKGDRGNNESK